ncbi:PAS domain-containing protein [Breoghania sp.]|uniref:PAS domain-containing protein n=1 Tax=Breoghania sp. TaxID=2065378 RepID=UPI0026059DA7|nr:PAS domain-containing protein [Breoghania sp.]MDJ0931207.1 PAS domain-containing protein [Breoghania sp.]
MLVREASSERVPPLLRGGEGTSTAIDYRRLFDELPTPYMVLDTELRFRDVNKAYLKTTGRNREDLIGRYIFDAFPGSEEETAPLEAALKQALTGEMSLVERLFFPIALSGEQDGRREL